MKRKFEEIGLETHEEREEDIDQSPLTEAEDWTIVDNEEEDQETPLIEKFWQLLETAGYECW